MFWHVPTAIKAIFKGARSKYPSMVTIVDLMETCIPPLQYAVCTSKAWPQRVLSGLVLYLSMQKWKLHLQALLNIRGPSSMSGECGPQMPTIQPRHGLDLEAG
jgi:hypothetical protein